MQKLDGSVRLPHGAGKVLQIVWFNSNFISHILASTVFISHRFDNHQMYRVAVFAEGASADEAREAGADVVGGPELVESIIAGDFSSFARAHTHTHIYF